MKRKFKNKDDEDFDISNEEISTLLDLLSCGFQSGRKVYLFGEIMTESILNIIEEIHRLEEKSNEDIEIFINSNGGYVVDCLALVDVMNTSKCHFQTTVLGIAASAACLIASNGTMGKRYSGKNSEFMFHEVFSDIPDFKASDAKYHTAETEKIQKRFTTIFSKNTGRTPKEITEKFYKNDHHKDVFMTSKQAKEFGIVDKIMPERNRKRERKNLNKEIPVVEKIVPKKTIKKRKKNKK